MNLQTHTPAPAATATSETGNALGIVEQVRVLEDVLEPVVSAMGYELVAVEWLTSARPRILRIYADHPEGFTLDDCARLSPIVSTALDAAEHHEAQDSALRIMLDAPYNLEVSSPGLDRPLVRRGHFERVVGQRVVVRTLAPITEGSNQKNFHGRVVEVLPDPDAPENSRLGRIRLADQDQPDILHEIPLAAIRRANLVYEGEI